MKKLAVFLMTICLPISVFADKPRFLPMLDGAQSRVYSDMESMNNNPQKPKLLVYYLINKFYFKNKKL